MSKHHIKRAVKLFRNELAPRHIRRANARNWLAAIDRLGSKWVCHPQHGEKA
jgi:hypothetical protein